MSNEKAYLVWGQCGITFTTQQDKEHMKLEHKEGQEPNR
jgi:hypothetical protein